MNKTSIEELFESIEQSDLYKKYKEMENILSQDDNIRKTLEEIKKLEQKATYLENVGDESYKEVDEEIKELSSMLDDNYIYQQYLNSMDDFNNELSMSSKIINDYVEEKV